MSRDLFRKEALEARRNQWLGGISLVQPVRTHVLTATAAFAALSVVLFLIFSTYTRRSSVTGQLVPVNGLSIVLAPETGVVIRLNVAEGEQVKLGQTLAVVATPRNTVTGGEATRALEQQLNARRVSLATLEAAQHHQRKAQAEGLGRQLAAAKKELERIEAETVTRQDRVKIADETLELLRQLEGKGYISALQIKQQQSTALDAIATLQSLQRQAASTRRNIAQLEQALRELPSQSQAASVAIQQDRAQLEQESVETSTRGALALESPVSGMVATQMVKPGQTVQAGQPMLVLLSGDGKLEAELLVPNRSIGFIEPGDRVLLRYQAFPFQKFSHHEGRISRISRSAVNLESGYSAAAQSNEPMYRVSVELAKQKVAAYGKLEPLMPGMLLDADILGENRRLIEWIFDPIYSLKSSLADD